MRTCLLFVTVLPCIFILAATELPYRAGVGYLRCINVVLSLRGWEQHHDALLAQPGLRGAALRCLLQQVLPALAAAMEAASAAGPD